MRRGDIMKKLLALCLCLSAGVLANASWEDDVLDGLKHSAKEQIEAFAQDIGAMTGMMDFKNGRADRFGAGAAVNVIKPSDKNFLKNFDDIDYIGMGYVYADAKIPLLAFALAARGTDIKGYQSIGGGLKYSIVGESILPFFPDITASVYYDKIDFDYFDANHYSASLAASVKILVFEPFVGIGYDKTDLKVKNTGANIIDGNKYSGSGLRYTGGLNLTLIPFVNIFASVSGTEDTYGAQAGLGISF
jgi:hypothetical protein